MKFIYTAKHKETGETRGGVLEAEDAKSLSGMLHAKGFLLTSHEEQKERKGLNVRFLDRIFGSVSLKDKMLFSRNLSIMIASGLQITRAIRTLVEQTNNKQFKKILASVADDVQAGNPLADALARYPRVFNELFVNMVRVGEMGGSLEEVLKTLTQQLEKEHALVSKVRGAMIYPSVIFVAMIGVGILMLTYILPKITGVFADMEVTLPASTRFIMAMSDFLIHNAFLASALAFAAVFGGYLFFQTNSGKRFLSFVTLHFPVVRGIVMKTNTARFARIYSSLLRSGVSVVEALNIISRTLSNFYYKDALGRAAGLVQKGMPLSKILASEQKIFNVLVYQIVEVGETTGKTEEVLLKLAEFYEEDVDQITKNLSSIIEPILMIVIGTGVGFFAVAMLTPMYSVLENIQ